MSSLLLRAVEHYLGSLSESENVYTDFLLLESEWEAPTEGGKLGVTEFQGEVWPVGWCDCELNLRREVLRSPSGKAVLLFPAQMDQKQQVPPDIRARSHRRTIHPLGLRHLLAAETGVNWPAEVDYSEWQPSILRHREALAKAASSELLNITRNGLERLLLRAAFRLEIEGHTAPEVLVDLYRQPPTQKPLPLELDILKGQLALHGIEGPQIILWAAEDRGRVSEFLITSAMMRVEAQAGLSPSWGALQPLLGKLLQHCSQAEALQSVIDLAWETWKTLPVNDRRSLMAQVERQLEKYQTVDLESYNDTLPRALRYRINQASEAMANGRQVTADLDEMKAHLFARDQQTSLQTLRWMDDMLDWQVVVGEVAASDRSAVEWAQWYREQGAFADLAALRLATSATPKLSQDVQAVLGNYWEARSVVNKSFAQALIADYEAAIYDPGIVGTHKILDKVVLPLMRDGERILLIVLDGLGYTGLIHLVQQLIQDQQRPSGVLTSHAGLSLLPSVTAASRKAIFLGERPTDTLDSEEDYTEKAKTSEQAALEKACKGYQVVLHNRTTLSRPGGKERLFTNISNPGLDLVALVLIEVDEALGSGVEPELHNPQDLGVFYEALTDGLNTGRRVLVVSDHGHTWHRSKDFRQGDQVPSGGQRYMPLKKGEVPPDHTVVTSDPEIVRSEEADSLAFLYRVGDYFGRQPKRGYHGGASLEEVVIPCVELGYGGRPLVPGARPEVKDLAATLKVREPAPTEGIVLTLQDGQRALLDVTGLSHRETQALQLLASFGRANEQQLRQHLGTRRVAGIMSKLMEKLGQAGLDLIEIGSAGPGGAEYIFRKSFDN